MRPAGTETNGKQEMEKGVCCNLGSYFPPDGFGHACQNGSSHQRLWTRQVSGRFAQSSCEGMVQEINHKTLMGKLRVNHQTNNNEIISWSAWWPWAAKNYISMNIIMKKGLHRINKIFWRTGVSRLFVVSRFFPFCVSGGCFVWTYLFRCIVSSLSMLIIDSFWFKVTKGVSMIECTGESSGHSRASLIFTRIQIWFRLAKKSTKHCTCLSCIKQI